MALEEGNLGTQLAKVLPRYLSTDVTRSIIIKFPIRDIVGYYRTLGWTDRDIFLKIFGLDPIGGSPTLERMVTVSGARGIRADYQTLLEMHPLTTFSHILAKTYVGRAEEAIRVFNECVPIMEYIMKTADDFDLFGGWGLKLLLTEIVGYLTFEDFRNYFPDTAIGHSMIHLIGESGNRELLYKMVESGHFSDNGYALTMTACRSRDVGLLNFLMSKNLYIRNAYQIHVIDSLTDDILLNDRNTSAHSKLSFDLGYRRIFREGIYRFSFVLGLLFSGYEGDLSSFLPIEDIRMHYTDFYDDQFVKNGYSFTNGVPANWRRLLELEPSLTGIIFSLAGIAGQVDVVDWILQSGPAFGLDGVSDGMPFFQIAF